MEKILERFLINIILYIMEDFYDFFYDYVDLLLFFIYKLYKVLFNYYNFCMLYCYFIYGYVYLKFKRKIL